MAWERSKDNETGMKQMDTKETRSVVVTTHPRKDIHTTREDEEKDVRGKEKNRNITPFVPLSPRLNQHSSRQNRVDEKNFLCRYGSPVQQKVSQ